MPRPIKGRRVGFFPEVTYFKPTGIPMRALEIVSLSIEELEAIRLKDQEGLQQEKCAEMMGISRPTFHRVLGSARRKIADALTLGKAIRIEGGNFEMIHHRFRCGWDGHEWEISPEEIRRDVLQICPRCRRANVERMEPFSPGDDRRRCRRGRGWRRKQYDAEDNGK